MKQVIQNIPAEGLKDAFIEMFNRMYSTSQEETSQTGKSGKHYL